MARFKIQIALNMATIHHRSMLMISLFLRKQPKNVAFEKSVGALMYTLIPPPQCLIFSIWVAKCSEWLQTNPHFCSSETLPLRINICFSRNIVNDNSDEYCKLSATKMSSCKLPVLLKYGSWYVHYVVKKSLGACYSLYCRITEKF